MKPTTRTMAEILESGESVWMTASRPDAPGLAFLVFTESGEMCSHAFNLAEWEEVDACMRDTLRKVAERAQ